MSFSSLQSFSSTNVGLTRTNKNVLEIINNFIFPCSLPAGTWDASASIAKNTFRVASGPYIGAYEIMTSTAVNLPMYGFDGSSNPFSSNVTYYEKRDNYFWYEIPNGNNSVFVSSLVPTIQTQYVGGGISGISTFRFDGSINSTNLQFPYTSPVYLNFSLSDASYEKINTYRGISSTGNVSWYFTTNYTDGTSNMTASGEWIQVKLPRKCNPIEIRFNCYNNSSWGLTALPGNTILLGSNDGVSWFYISKCLFRPVNGTIFGVHDSTSGVDISSASPLYRSQISTLSTYYYFRLVVLSTVSTMGDSSITVTPMAFTSMRIYGTLY